MKRKLGLFETAQLMTDQFSPFNVVIIVGIDKLLKKELIVKTLDILQKRHPLLRSVISGDNKNWYFEEKSDSLIDLEHIKRTSDYIWKTYVEKELNTGFNISEQPLIRCRYISSKLYPNKSEVILTIHHSIIDAISSNNLIDEFLNICSSKKSKSVDFEDIPDEYLSPAEYFYPSKFKGLRKYYYMVSYLGRQMIDELKYNRLADDLKPPLIQKSGGCRIIQKILPKDLTTNLIDKSRKNGVTLYHVCNAALVRSVVINMYRNKKTMIRNFNFPNLRPYLIPVIDERHAGAYHSLLRYTVDYLPDINFWELAKLIQNKFGASIRKGDKFISPLLSVKMMDFFLKKKTMRMGNIALSYTGSSNIKSHYGDLSVLGFNGFISNNILGPQITGQVNLFNKELYWNIGYLDNDVSLENANKIADDIIQILTNSLKNS